MGQKFIRGDRNVPVPQWRSKGGGGKIAPTLKNLGKRKIF